MDFAPGHPGAVETAFKVGPPYQVRVLLRVSVGLGEHSPYLKWNFRYREDFIRKILRSPDEVGERTNVL